MMVVPNLAETVEVSTVSASNCGENCWPEGGAVSSLFTGFMMLHHIL